MEIKKIKIIKRSREEGPNRNKKMRYFKIPLCRNFVWKIGDYFGPNDACQWCLRSKIGVWQLSIDGLVFPILGGDNKQLAIWTWSSNKLFERKYYCLILILKI